MAQMEIKKMKQGMSYSCKEKVIILNVFKYFRMEFPDFCVTEIVRRTSKATGCSEKSIFQFRKEEASGQGFKVPSTTKIRRNVNINSRDIKYDNTVRQGIRSIIYDLKYKNITTSLNTILKHVNQDAQLPNFSLMTLRRLLFDMGFCYEKQGNKSILVEKPTVKKEVKQEKSGKSAKKPQKVAAQNIHPATEQVNSMDSINKPGPQIPQSNITMLSNHHLISTQQNHRLLPMHMTQHDNNHMMQSVHMPHHNMSMMLNHRMPPSHPMPPSNVSLNITPSHPMPPSNVNLNVRPDVPPWMHHPPHAMMKQE
ncbi:hypothetical protein Zmor_010969 [Zophobas morio]|uniref:Uncharacterized protein n=1 Tax=Zophobas morio TaxID=2755281 RepID=A0AA38MKF1_9CUCU|nr:hypothetical protein Zmor_010969 [Zophobas morio]